MPDRYENVRYLGCGSYCTAYLVRHKSLETERVLKLYSKEQFHSSSDIQEAQLLKKLNHPCIPMIYDLFESEEAFCVVEEYIDGEALNSFLLNQPKISVSFFQNLMDRLCDIFTYLHSFPLSPILYRDLKPDHIMIRGSEVRLVDFGISNHTDQLNQNMDGLGNKDFSAPECAGTKPLSVQSDIYSLGRLMEYLLPFLEISAFSQQIQIRRIRKMIRKATDPDPDLRYETVEALRQELKSINNQKDRSNLEHSIAIIGSHSGCGATTAAISLVSCLNAEGIASLYYEKNANDSLRKMKPFLTGCSEANGCLYYRFFMGYPLYGPGIKINYRQAQIRVYDYGTDYDIDLLADHDLVLLVTSDEYWHFTATGKILSELRTSDIPCRILVHASDKALSSKLSTYLSESVFLFNDDRNFFGVTPAKRRLFHKLLSGTAFL